MSTMFTARRSRQIGRFALGALPRRRPERRISLDDLERCYLTPAHLEIAAERLILAVALGLADEEEPQEDRTLPTGAPRVRLRQDG